MTTLVAFPMTDHDPFQLVRRTKLGRDQRGLCGPIAVELRPARRVRSQIRRRKPQRRTRWSWKEFAVSCAVVFAVGCAAIWWVTQ
jgi:hypothetical protein